MVRRVVVLDTSVLGIATNPSGNPEAVGCIQWLLELGRNGHTVVLPEIADYELRRELLLQGKTHSLARLNALHSQAVYVAITTEAMLLAADFWAQARRQGRKTADDKALDGDVILAAQASLLTHLGDEVVVATTNVKHLSMFVDARLWQDVPAQE
jgi:predicted nucleic acid-binding protein